jgi:hypothetical protein
MKIKIKNCDVEGKVTSSVVHRSTERPIVINVGKNSSEYFSTRFRGTKYGVKIRCRTVLQWVSIP